MSPAKKQAPESEPATFPEAVQETEAVEAEVSVEEKATNSAPDSDPVEMVSTSDADVPEDADPAVVTVVYMGIADVFRYDPYAFRPGVPATVPKSLAEELLTFPFERFEVKE